MIEVRLNTEAVVGTNVTKAPAETQVQTKTILEKDWIFYWDAHDEVHGLCSLTLDMYERFFEDVSNHDFFIWSYKRKKETLEELFQQNNFPGKILEVKIFSHAGESDEIVVSFPNAKQKKIALPVPSKFVLSAARREMRRAMN